jgi:hypothetical protein
VLPINALRPSTPPSHEEGEEDCDYCGCANSSASHGPFTSGGVCASCGAIP